MASLKEHIKTFVKLNVFALGILHISNRFISSFSRFVNTLSSAAEKFYRWKYGDIFYHKAGEGSPIILLHDLNHDLNLSSLKKIYYNNVYNYH